MEFNVVQQIALYALPLIFAITLHEVAHGYVASWFGDQTARLSGRLSLNPIKHIDPVGTVILPLLTMVTVHVMFGWAKPVPVNSDNLRRPRRDMVFVAAAGPLSNFVMAFAWAAIAKIALLLYMAGYVWFGKPLVYMGQIGVYMNVFFACLNLLPIPPLDGGNIVKNLLPPRLAYSYGQLEQYGFLIIILLLLTNALTILVPMVYSIVQVIFALFGLTGLLG